MDVRSQLRVTVGSSNRYTPNGKGICLKKTVYFCITENYRRPVNSIRTSYCSPSLQWFYSVRLLSNGYNLLHTTSAQTLIRYRAVAVRILIRPVTLSLSGRNECPDFLTPQFVLLAHASLSVDY